MCAFVSSVAVVRGRIATPTGGTPLDIHISISTKPASHLLTMVTVREARLNVTTRAPRKCVILIRCWPSTRGTGNSLLMASPRHRHCSTPPTTTLLGPVTADSRIRGASDDVSDCPAPRAGRHSRESMLRYFAVRACQDLRCANASTAQWGACRKGGAAEQNSV